MSTTQMSHPRGLYTLFFTEMWERFSYYGMRALLVLYLTSMAMSGGFGMDRADALEIYALFTGLAYVTPILGGFLADKYLGQRKAVFIGGLVMALGQFSLAASMGSIGAEAVADGREFFLHLGLGLLIMGNGFFKPNISTIVGELYESNDPRKDSAFTIFYMGINLGAFLSPLICGTLGEKVGWSYGFTAAGIGMLLGLVWFYTQGKTLEDAGFPPNREEKKLIGRDYIEILIIAAGVIAAVVGFLKLWPMLGDSQGTILSTLGIGGVAALAFVIIKNTSGSDEWSRVGVIFVLAFFNIFFWAGFEQAGGTFNLFAAENTDRTVFGYEIAASAFQSINAIAIFAFAPLFSMLWVWLDGFKKNPSTPLKFSIGLAMLGLGFVVMSGASAAAAGGDLISPLWLLAVYVIHTFGELCLSPIGLSMVTKLAPKKIVSVMMGLWFGFMALANYLAGVLENILHTYMPDMPLFTFLTITSFAAAAAVLALTPMLRKMMKGIH